MTNRLKNNIKLPECILLVLFIVSALSACDEQTVYHAFRSIPQEGWKRQDTLFFHVSVPDSQTSYRLTLEVRNRNTYPYQNLNLSVCYTGPGVGFQPADTLETTLANQEGRWQGDGWGGLYQSAFAAGSVRIEQPGDYLFKVSHTLPDEILPGINDVGIKLQR